MNINMMHYPYPLFLVSLAFILLGSHPAWADDVAVAASEGGTNTFYAQGEGALSYLSVEGGNSTSSKPTEQANCQLNTTSNRHQRWYIDWTP
ncbi:MAG: hypothetical protein AAFX99_18505 [Myxococcota bacterium]